jgi:hypothetical protein
MRKPLTTISLVCDCSHKACKLGLFWPLRIPIEAYQEVQSKSFLLPIPKSTPITPGGVLVYMSMEDSMRLPFIDAHRLSKKARVSTAVAHDVTSTSSSVATQVRGRGRDIRGRGTGGRG